MKRKWLWRHIQGFFSLALKILLDYMGEERSILSLLNVVITLTILVQIVLYVEVIQLIAYCIVQLFLKEYTYASFINIHNDIC